MNAESLFAAQYIQFVLVCIINLSCFIVFHILYQIENTILFRELNRFEIAHTSHSENGVNALVWLYVDEIN